MSTNHQKNAVVVNIEHLHHSELQYHKGWLTLNFDCNWILSYDDNDIEEILPQYASITSKIKFVIYFTEEPINLEEANEETRAEIVNEEKAITERITRIINIINSDFVDVSKVKVKFKLLKHGFLHLDCNAARRLIQ